MLPASERDGFCECGCGRRTSLAAITRTARGDVAGLPVRFIVGHVNARKTHCLRGHPLDGDNLYLHPDGRRECRTCKRIAGAAYMRRKRAAA